MNNPSRILIAFAAAIVLVGAVAVRINPSLIIMASRGVDSRSPYCSKWKAALDGKVKLHQQADAYQLARRSRVVRRDGDLELWSTPDGEWWVPGDRDQGRTPIITLLLAQEKRHIYGGSEWGVRRGDAVLDIGAYVGTWTKDALANGAAKVISIEPSPQSLECLRRNLAKEIAAGTVIVVPKGAWDSEGDLTFFESGNGVGNSFVEKNAAARAVNSIPVSTVDRIVTDLHLQRVDFLKADVKGATVRVLRGAEQTIRRDRPRIALSTEEVADDVAEIAATGRRIVPDYRVVCGPCLLDGRTIYTDTLLFH